jgi:phosphoglucomutase
MILGKNGFFVTPSDSLAVITSHMKCIPHFVKHPATGVARSMPTSTAVDKVAERFGLNLYEVPTGRYSTAVNSERPLEFAVLLQKYH